MRESSTTLMQLVRIMNWVSIVLFMVCFLHLIVGQNKAAANTDGALTVVPQEDDDGDDSVEVNVVEDLSGEITNDETFNPTAEWQTVKEGQAIPAGLHVRLNMETGDREAKLMDGDSGLKYWKAGDKNFGGGTVDRKQMAVSELKKALKDFKTTELDETNLQHEAEVKAKFRNYEELKKDFEEMNLKMQTDGELMTDLFKRFKEKDFENDKFDYILYDLEYHLHKIDGAVVFKDLGGIPLLIKLINVSRHEDVQIEAALALGSATHSNPQVQVAALEAGGLQVLLRCLSLSSSSELQRKLLYALVSICKHFPFAQKHLIELGGVSALRQVVATTNNDKLKVKTVVFLNDLVVEKDEVNRLDSTKTSDEEKIYQYSQVLIREALVEQGWCQVIPPLLHVAGHDSREQVLTVVKTLTDLCPGSFQHSSPILSKLRAEYVALASEYREHDTSDDMFYTGLVKLIDEIKQKLNIKDEL